MSWQRLAASLAADAGSRAGVSVDKEVAMLLRENDLSCTGRCSIQYHTVRHNVPLEMH
jgi:hypothetical protein